MARRCARIDSRLDTAKIGSDGRVEIHRARLLAVLGDEKRFHTAWVKSCPDGGELRLTLSPQERTQLGHPSMSEKCQSRPMHRSKQYPSDCESPDLEVWFGRYCR